MTLDEFHPDSFMARLDADSRRTVEHAGTLSSYAARSILFHQGDPSRHVVLLLKGWAKVTSISRNGEEALLALRGPGDILGELAAVDDKPRSATIYALQGITALVIDGDRFVRLLTQHSTVALALLRHISRNLREADRSRLEYVSTSSSGRLAALILKLAVDHGERSERGVVIGLPLSQRELAMAAATSREVAARTLRKLRERDIVRTARQRIEVVRPEVLRSFCHSVPADR